MLLKMKLIYYGQLVMKINLIHTSSIFWFNYEGIYTGTEIMKVLELIIM